MPIFIFSTLWEGEDKNHIDILAVGKSPGNPPFGVTGSRTEPGNLRETHTHFPDDAR